MSTTYTTSCDACGWISNPSRSAKQAAHAYRLHSCERWQAKAAATQRGKDRDAAVDRTPKPCHHKRTTHTHGTHACYVLDRCRCRPCATANTTYERNRIRQHAYGRWDNYVDAQPARDHVKKLQAAGMGLKQIVAATGGEFSQGAMTRLMYGRTQNETNRREGPTERISKDHAAAILAVTVTLAGGARVDGTGTRRRLQALVAIGWSQQRLAKQIGQTGRNFGRLIHGENPAVTVTTAAKVRALYDDLWNTTPPLRTRHERTAYTRSTGYAAAHGWVPPMAWDDDVIDNPDITADDGPVDTDQDHLDELAIAHVLNGHRVRLTTAERRAAVRKLTDDGWSAQQIADQLRVTQRTVTRDRAAQRTHQTPTATTTKENAA